MRIVKYDFKYVISVAKMLVDYFKELHPGEDTGGQALAEQMLNTCDYYDKAIYLLLNDNNRPVGFLICYLNDQYGMVPKYLTVEYQYLKPEYRNGMALAHQFDMIGRICEDYNCGTVSATYTSSKNIHNLDKLGANVIALTTALSAEEVKEKHQKFKTRIDNVNNEVNGTSVGGNT